MEELWAAYTPASKRLVQALSHDEVPARDDLLTVNRLLDAYLGSLNLTPSAREEIIAETMLRLVSGVRRRIVDERENVASYIRTIALNCVRDASRYRSRRPTASVAPDRLPEPHTDDQIAAMMDAVTSAAEVHAALELANADGDIDLVIIISSWMQVAERIGDAPSLREVAHELEVSHMRVSRALMQFAAYVQQARQQGRSPSTEARS